MNAKVLKIAIVVHGRFDAFDLARELIKEGQDVRLFTNYPKWAVRHFGISAENIRSFWFHGILARTAQFLHDNMRLPYPEAWLNVMFGRWAAKNIINEPWDVVHTWSGVSEEVLLALRGSVAAVILLRGSSHIKTQVRLLQEEKTRTGEQIEKPSKWMIAREVREYDLSDYIRILSSFACLSFITEGVAKEKLLLIPSGVPVGDFKPAYQIIEERYKRILSGRPLKVLYVGALSFRKGLQDLKTIIDEPKTGKFQFRFVGTILKESIHKHLKSEGNIEYVVKQPQYKLPKQYAWADLFIFPTIEDGYAAVMAQAQASGLPIITTTNCSGPDIITEGKTGWVLPIRAPGAFIDKLLWCDSHRNELAEMVKNIYENHKPKDWNDVAKNFIDICADLKEKHK
ncbi:MAG: glycosyltransferase family 4 protein [Candidatus Omnitrophica bacterium]|nr:glycosyltransferase family 4 protein [Candidatus Omnitrophota bacterium]